MQEGQNSPEEWQQPKESPSAAPFEAADQGGQIDAGHGDNLQPSEAQEEVGPDDEALLRWEGTEYLHHTRGPLWFVVAGVTTLTLVLFAILVLHSITFALLLPVMAIALFVYVQRPPEMLNYILSRKGLHIGDKLFSYDQFKSFGVMSHGGSHSVILIPRKRFQIGQSIYFPEEIGEKLVDFLAARLPMKDVKPDLVDRLLGRIHL